MNAKYILAIVIAMGISFSFSFLNADLAKPWNQSSWSSYSFNFLGSNALNPDYSEITMEELLLNEINTSGMDDGALGLMNDYENDLADTVVARVECGTFFRFDQGNSLDADTFVLGTVRDWLTDGTREEQDARFLYSNKDSANVIGVEGEKYFVEVKVGNKTVTETHYRIGDTSSAKASLNPSDLAAFQKLVMYFDAEHSLSRPIDDSAEIVILMTRSPYYTISDLVRDRAVDYYQSRNSCLEYDRKYRETLDDLD